MVSVPDDLDVVIREIDEELQAEGVKPHQRPIHAIMKFGQRFKISIPIVPVPAAAGPELFANNKYCEAIHDWYGAEYGDRIKMDPSGSRRVAVLAAGDVWELRLPLLWGSARVHVQRELMAEEKGFQIGQGGTDIYPCNQLTGITQNRLDRFSDDDLNEVGSVFDLGFHATGAMQKRFQLNNFYQQCPGDLTTAVELLTAQLPNYGQSRYASLMLVERFMKGMHVELGLGQPKRIHKLDDLHSDIAKSVNDFDISGLLPAIDCKPAVRYGEEPSTLEQAYRAHKASLMAVRVLGSIEVFKPDA